MLARSADAAVSKGWVQYTHPCPTPCRGLPILAALLAVVLTLQSEPLKVGATLSYDKVKDLSTATANLGLCTVGEGNAAGMFLSYT